MIQPQRVARSIEEELRARGTPERAAGEKKYLKSDLKFFGTRMPEIRQALRAFVSQNRDLAHEDVVSLVEELWARPIFECRAAAVILLQAYGPLLTPRDLLLIERLLRESLTWALVDPLAIDVVGSLVIGHPAVLRRLDRWASDPDFWIRRSALLGLMPSLKQGEDFTRFFDYADAMLEEKEFFIRKAIGWVLREVGKKRPDEVWNWLAPRAHRASGVTTREAAKYLGDRRKEALLAAYREGRPLDPSLS